jgi:hypothetical protein
MSDSIANTVSALALAAGILAYVYLKYRSRQRRIEVIHQERMAAIEKGIALPEYTSEPIRLPDERVLPILGTVFISLSTGAMLLLLLCLPAPTRGIAISTLPQVVFYLNVPAISHTIWLAPLPLTCVGLGLLTFHFSKANSR